MDMSKAQEPVVTWEEFCRRWSGLYNFRMTGEVVPFDFEWPSVEEIVDAIRSDEEARIWRGAQGDRLDRTDVSDWFRSLPLEEAVRSRVQMSHFNLQRVSGPGQVLEGLFERVVQPWQEALRANGFTWDRMNPIVFLSGPQCHTNYHMDGSHVLAIQVAGTKVFCATKDPQRWAPHEARRTYWDTSMPEGITEDDVIRYEMKPGDVLWNPILIPHWVYAGDETAYSLNISHGGLRLNGELSPLGAELVEIEAARRASRAG